MDVTQLADALSALTPEQLELVKTFSVQQVVSYKELAMALAIGFGAIGPGVGVGLIGQGALSAIGRNPDAADKVQGFAIICIAFAEAVAIYALVISLLIGFAL